ncbi:MAG: hypothetical protein OXG78_00910 [Chloroflexi bacterium]|nr:hypothetical protein [Chloroflexota bacterium]
MFSNPISAPSPDLRIVCVDAILPHEKSDVQRSRPLMERLKKAEFFTNPPLVAELPDSRYVLMDGSNRHISMSLLGFEHILVQILDYESDYVELGVWQHVVADWESQRLLQELEAIEGTDIRTGWDSNAVAQILLRDGPVYSIHAVADGLAERNATLTRVVSAYHNSATLYRTPLSDPGQIWPLFPSGIALIMFPAYQPEDIIAAALERAFLPPGVSRHIVHGRALNVNYPMERLRAETPLEAKNDILQTWLREQYAARSIRYYAESTFQFAE